MQVHVNMGKLDGECQKGGWRVSKRGMTNGKEGDGECQRGG